MSVGGGCVKVIGLCGGSGSGKGTVANIFSFYGIPSIDTDAVYHNLTSTKTPCLEALVNEFGVGVLDENGLLDRKKLAKIVFAQSDSDTKLHALNSISHKFVLDKTREILENHKKCGTPAVIVDAPLLFESGFNNECDAIIAVVADDDIKISRIMKRDIISKEDAIARIKKQLPDEYLVKNADYIINNCTNLSDVEIMVREIAEKILTT